MTLRAETWHTSNRVTERMRSLLPHVLQYSAGAMWNRYLGRDWYSSWDTQGSQWRLWRLLHSDHLHSESETQTALLHGQHCYPVCVPHPCCTHGQCRFFVHNL